LLRAPGRDGLRPRPFRSSFEELAQRLCELRARAPPVNEANVFIKGVTRLDLAFRTR
jgi:hypothetical protein